MNPGFVLIWFEAHSVENGNCGDALSQLPAISLPLMLEPALLAIRVSETTASSGQDPLSFPNPQFLKELA